MTADLSDDDLPSSNVCTMHDFNRLFCQFCWSHFDNTTISANKLHYIWRTVWVKKITPLQLLSIFAKRLGIFNWNFANLLCVKYTKDCQILSNYLQILQSYAALSATTPRILSLSLLQNINFLITYLLPDLNPLDYHVCGAMLQAFHKICLLYTSDAADE